MFTLLFFKDKISLSLRLASNYVAKAGSNYVAKVSL